MILNYQVPKVIAGFLQVEGGREGQRDVWMPRSWAWKWRRGQEPRTVVASRAGRG